jgi:hypothetical protein
MREDLLEGKLEYPGFMSIIKWIEKEEDIYAFWNSLWFSFLNNDDINGLYWYERLGAKCFNEIVRALDAHGWVTSQSMTGRKWASVELREEKLLTWVTPDELQAIKAKYKYQKYCLTATKSTVTKLVKQNNTIRDTGLVRQGFCAAGNSKFKYDMAKLADYENPVKLNLVKSMDKIRQMYPEMRSDSATYDNICNGLFDWHTVHADKVFTTGNSISDSRGRAISDCLSKATNPISNKDFRSALLITYPDE